MLVEDLDWVSAIRIKEAAAAAGGSSFPSRHFQSIVVV
jgi:hypothetical protein